MGTDNRQITALRVGRIAAGLRLADVASGCNRSIMYVQRLETGGYARLTPATTEKIASIIGVPPEKLFTEVPE